MLYLECYVQPRPYTKSPSTHMNKECTELAQLCVVLVVLPCYHVWKNQQYALCVLYAATEEVCICQVWLIQAIMVLHRSGFYWDCTSYQVNWIGVCAQLM